MTTSDPNSDKRLRALCSAILELETRKEVSNFLEDILTPAETAAVAERWTVALLLKRGLSYRAINAATGVSTATVTRVARCVARGAGGYRLILERSLGDLK